MENMDIRFKAKAAGVPLWKIAAKMGVSEPTIHRRLRKEMNEEEKHYYFNVIHEIEQEQANSILQQIEKKTPSDDLKTKARASRAEYYREWRKKNPGKTSEYQRRYWENKVLNRAK